jgi:hypothetical protein
LNSGNAGADRHTFNEGSTRRSFDSVKSWNLNVAKGLNYQEWRYEMAIKGAGGNPGSITTKGGDGAGGSTGTGRGGGNNGRGKSATSNSKKKSPDDKDNAGSEHS